MTIVRVRSTRPFERWREARETEPSWHDPIAKRRSSERENPQA